MWSYDKHLIHPVKIKRPDAKAATVIMSQLGGPHGELGAATRYLSQRYSCPFGEITGILTEVPKNWRTWRWFLQFCISLRKI